MPRGRWLTQEPVRGDPGCYRAEGTLSRRDHCAGPCSRGGINVSLRAVAPGSMCRPCCRAGINVSLRAVAPVQPVAPWGPPAPDYSGARLSYRCRRYHRAAATSRPAVSASTPACTEHVTGEAADPPASQMRRPRRPRPGPRRRWPSRERPAIRPATHAPRTTPAPSQTHCRPRRPRRGDEPAGRRGPGRARRGRRAGCGP